MKLISYAQNHEDILLRRLFVPDVPGFYIDVGAAHPVAHSTTKLFYDRGWRGINVEPHCGFFHLLCAARPRDVNLNIALSDREGDLAFYEIPSCIGQATCEPAVAERLRAAGVTLLKRSVEAWPLARVCERYVDGPIDFLKVDVEGHERAVLRGGDWRRWRPRVVLVEATEPGTPKPSHEGWEPILLEGGYLFAAFDGLNRYYVREEDRPLCSLLAVPVNIFDDFMPYEYLQRIETLQAELERASSQLALARAVCRENRAHLEASQRALVQMRTLLLEAGSPPPGG